MFLKVFNKKNKKIASVIKLFKVVSSKQVHYPVKNIIELCHQMLYDKTRDSIQNLEVNYGDKKWKNIDSFYKFISNNKDYPIVYFYAGGAKELDTIIYSNNILNKTIKDSLDFLSITISFYSIFITDKDIIGFVKDIYKIINIDYGYSFYLGKNQDISSEKKIKKSFFSYSTTVDEKDIEQEKNMIEIRSGYIPKLYSFNILNKKQFIQIKQNSTAENTTVINDELILYKQP